VSGISGFVDISSLVPPPVDSANRGSGRGEEPSGEILRLIRIRLATLSFEKSRPVVKQETRNPEPPIGVLQTRSTFHPLAQHNAYRRPGARQQSRSFIPSLPMDWVVALAWVGDGELAVVAA